MLEKIPLLLQPSVLLLSISPLERDLVELSNCPLLPEVCATRVGLVDETPAPGKSCILLDLRLQAGQNTVGYLKWQEMHS